MNNRQSLLEETLNHEHQRETNLPSNCPPEENFLEFLDFAIRKTKQSEELIENKKTVDMESILRMTTEINAEHTYEQTGL